ncbi:hypothetical protein L6258_01890 [Candidatus Parcubacteria bacterium]|nr:hypothetical protein [Candidatus Parcubacteria bacterium]
MAKLFSNFVLTVVLVGLLGAPLLGFGALREADPREATEHQFGAALSVHDHSYDALLDFPEAKPPALLETVSFTAFANQKAVYKDFLKLKNETDEVKNYRVVILDLEGDLLDQQEVLVYFGNTPTRLETALAPGQETCLTLSVAASFSHPSQLQSTLTLAVVER